MLTTDRVRELLDALENPSKEVYRNTWIRDMKGDGDNITVEVIHDVTRLMGLIDSSVSLKIRDVKPVWRASPDAVVHIHKVDAHQRYRDALARGERVVAHRRGGRVWSLCPKDYYGWDSDTQDFDYAIIAPDPQSRKNDSSGSYSEADYDLPPLPDEEMLEREGYEMTWECRKPMRGEYYFDLGRKKPVQATHDWDWVGSLPFNGRRWMLRKKELEDVDPLADAIRNCLSESGCEYRLARVLRNEFGK